MDEASMIAPKREAQATPCTAIIRGARLNGCGLPLRGDGSPHKGRPRPLAREAVVDVWGRPVIAPQREAQASQAITSHTCHPQREATSHGEKWVQHHTDGKQSQWCGQGQLLAARGRKALIGHDCHPGLGILPEGSRVAKGHRLD
uniref:Uncharacterized protein n=1 Tax=Pipistrellus kuhlii TaxID=59472 RepID=A0A7J7T0D9_PIPKU|nr:hypothetical protein mPipKuh1_009739 [Pipistrellus kuhlii]